MTAPFTLIRLEIPDNSLPPSSLHYTSLGFPLLSADVSPSRHVLDSCSDVTKGRRIFSTITIETFMAEDIQAIVEATVHERASDDARSRSASLIPSAYPIDIDLRTGHSEKTKDAISDWGGMKDVGQSPLMARKAHWLDSDINLSNNAVYGEFGWTVQDSRSSEDEEEGEIEFGDVAEIFRELRHREKHDGSQTVNDGQKDKHEDSHTVIDGQYDKHDDSQTVNNGQKDKHDDGHTVKDGQKDKHEGSHTVKDGQKDKHEGSHTVKDEPGIQPSGGHDAVERVIKDAAKSERLSHESLHAHSFSEPPRRLTTEFPAFSESPRRSATVSPASPGPTSHHVEVHVSSEVSSRTFTISGALKQPLLKTKSIEYYGDRPHPPGDRPHPPVPAEAAAVDESTVQVQIQYSSGNPSVEITQGIIHLFKSNQAFPVDRQGAGPSTGQPVGSSQMLCMLAIPMTMTSHDLIQFLAPSEADIEHIKVIKDTSPSHYMVMVKFRTDLAACQFYRNNNGKRFNSLEEDVCHLVFVAKIESIKTTEGGDMAVPGMTELPTCPVCLERMDESISGLLTILCNHSFHTSCLAHWEDATCPVCRYIQTPERIKENQCFQCGAVDNVWICLICGHVGCGRYVEGHAFEHFRLTNHTFAMQLGARCVWDYASDNFVHRLVLNTTDGKMVQVEEGEVVASSNRPPQVEGEDKMDAVSLEFTYLLTKQLEAQRQYFEKRMENMEKEFLRQIEVHEEKARQSLDQCNQLEQKLAAISKDRQSSDRKNTQSGVKLKSVQSELEEERALNQSLQTNQRQWIDQVTQLEENVLSKDKELTDLKEQLRDVMFYMDAQEKLAASSDVSREELDQSQIVMPPSEKKQGRGHRKKGR